MTIFNEFEGKVARLWNAGLTRDEAVHIAGEEAGKLFDQFEDQYDSACIPRERWTGKPKIVEENTDPEYLAWKGEIGCGAKLRQIIEETRS